jgi:predicted DNA-binding antitoxin AbrB/MazE fold protein
MARTINAVYDGSVLKPEEPLELAPHTRVRLRIEALTSTETGGSDLSRGESTAAGTAEPDPILQLGTAPVECDVVDASEQHDRYLYSR